MSVKTMPIPNIKEVNIIYEIIHEGVLNLFIGTFEFTNNDLLYESKALSILSKRIEELGSKKVSNIHFDFQKGIQHGYKV